MMMRTKGLREDMKVIWTLYKLYRVEILLKILVFVAASIFIATFLVIKSDAATFQWRHFGAAPFAFSRTEAMQKRNSAFLALGIPKGAVQLLMNATEKPGIPATLVVGQKLSAMISEGGRIHHDVVIAFNSPVLHMQYAAPAEKWKITWRGKVYTIFLPVICHNWSVVITPAKCASTTFQVKPGDLVRLGVFTKNGERLPSDCWSLSDGSVVSAAPSPCAECNWEGVLSVLPDGFRVEYSGLYRAHSRTQTLRFPREVTKDYIALCVTREGLGESDSWIVPPRAWNGNSIIHIPYSRGNRWPVWGPAAVNYDKK